MSAIPEGFAAPEEKLPPKTTVLRPIGARVLRLPSDETLVEFELPYEVIGIMLPPDGKAALVQALTGGVIIPDGPAGLA